MKALVKFFAMSTLGLMAFDAAALAQTPGPVIMIAGEDAYRDTTPRGSVNFNRIQHAIAERLRNGGFSVYDEADVVADPPPARTARPVSKLLEGVRLAKTPVDAIMVIQVV